GSNEIAAIYNADGAGKCALTPVAPSITQQPVSQTVTQGQTAIFTVGVGGTGPFTYQWKVGSSNIPGATLPGLVLTNVQPGQAGSYSVVVANSLNTLTSSSAQLTVIPIAPPPNCLTPPIGLASWWK